MVFRCCVPLMARCQESWSRCTRELLQWDALKEFGSATNNVIPVIDGCARLGQFDAIRCVSPPVQRAALSPS